MNSAHPAPGAADGHPRVTVEELALRLKVAKSTVSLALRNHPKISEAMKKRVRKAAEEAGYRPDPVYSELMARIRMKDSRARGENLAYISPIRFSKLWMFKKAYNEFYEGARRRASLLGYGMDVFILGENGLTEKRLNSVLINRGIRGVIFASHTDFYSIHKFSWSRFSTAAIEFGLTEPKLHRVCNHYWHLMNEGMSQLIARDYRRPGFVMSRNSSERVDNAWLAAFLVAQQRLPGKNRTEPCIFGNFDYDEAMVVQWLAAAAPDVLITDNEKIFRMLKRMKIRVPEDMGLLLLNPQREGNFFAGLRTRNEVVGGMAVETVVNQLYRSEAGLPEPSMTISIEGQWQDGISLRPPKKRGSIRGLTQV